MEYIENTNTWESITKGRLGEIYIGRGTKSIYDATHGGKTLDRWLKIDPEDANHILFLGPSGFQKTTTMKAFLQEIWLNTRWGRENEPPLIIIFERKYDRSKAQLVKETFWELLDKRGEDWLRKNLENYVDWIIYIQMLENPGHAGEVGLMGDFALGWENILAYRKYDGKRMLASIFDIHPQRFPIRRFVFNPTREVKHIAIDSGPETEVIPTFLHYDRLSFEDIAKLININPNTIYAQLVRTAWDDEKIRDPDRLILETKRIYNEMLQILEIDNQKPPTTLWGVYNVAKNLKKIKILQKPSKGPDLLDQINNDKINVIDFSQNSDLTERQKMIIFKKVVEWALNEWPKKKDTAVFIAGDEIHNYLRSRWGMEIISKLFREGRSNQVNFFVATQYLHSLPSEIVYGASHIAILGTLASADDYALLKKSCSRL
ncbi:helicase HerA domain-containing protein [Thermococcus barophilus]|uniref:Helicase HerA central domain-containing protein n=1 Tax=Thermococcus barophilus TaxID=55802 RepID=A0A0S1XAM7_THEBA|nr:DUF87 domain-containing protein [Thermococcus barophilus]ALM74846.1 hypothetical protein TBCH5v1_0894 [Thermococcus barophilus]